MVKNTRKGMWGALYPIGVPEHKKKKKKGHCRSDCGAVRVGITVLYRYRYCHPTTRLSRADLENHQQ